MNTLDLFIADETALYKRVTEKVAADPLIFAGLKKWDVYNATEKRDFLERYARLLAKDLTATLSPDIEFYEKAGTLVGAVMHFESGHFSPQQGFVPDSKIRINIHPDVLGGTTLASQLELIAHEMTHKRQTDIIQSPSMAGEKHAAAIPALFKDNFAHYLNGDEGFAAYRAQPVEAHAFAMGEFAAENILAFAAKREWISNPYGDTGRKLEFQVNSAQGGSLDLHPGGILTSDPNAHYWAARGAEAKLAQTGRGSQGDWFDIMNHYSLAVRCGEFVSFNAEPALAALGDLAEGSIYAERPGKEDRLLQVPPAIQKQAREALEKFAQSPASKVRLTAKRFVKRLEKRALKQSKPTAPARN